MSITDVKWDFAELDDPPAELIEEMRRWFPTERETDAQLVRKLQRRAHGSIVRAGLVGRAGGRAAGDARREIDGDFEVSNARWFTGGASKIQMGFDADLARAGPTSHDAADGPGRVAQLRRASCASSSCCGP